MQPKTVADSRTEQVHILMPPDINGQGRLFGGILMQWVDVVAAVVARRHSGCNVTTAAIDHLKFLAPAHINDTVFMVGKLTYVGRTSMEVCVDTFVEELDGTRNLVNRAYLVMVALDGQDKPHPVPPLLCSTEEEEQEYEAAHHRCLHRKTQSASV